MKISLVSVFTLFTTFALGFDDTIQNRMAQADRYMKTTPVEKMMNDMFEQLSATMFDDSIESAEFRETIVNAIDIRAITNLTRDKLVIHFTADELSALADFYGSKHGKAAMSKFGVYMADIMPQLQVFIEQAITKIGSGTVKNNRPQIKPEFSDLKFDSSYYGETKFYEINQLITNLGGPEKSRYINIEMRLEGIAGDFERVLEMYEHRIRDAALTILGEYTYHDSQLEGFKERVRSDFKKAFSQVLIKYRDKDSDMIQKIYFTRFVVQ